MSDYAETTRIRLNEVLSDDSIYKILEMKGRNKWPFSSMDVGDEVSFYPHCDQPVRAAHSYGQHHKKKFQCRREWPLTIVRRIA